MRAAIKIVTASVIAVAALNAMAWKNFERYEGAYDGCDSYGGYYEAAGEGDMSCGSPTMALLQ